MSVTQSMMMLTLGSTTGGVREQRGYGPGDYNRPPDFIPSRLTEVDINLVYFFIRSLSQVIKFCISFDAVWLNSLTICYTWHNVSLIVLSGGSILYIF